MSANLRGGKTTPFEMLSKIDRYAEMVAGVQMDLPMYGIGLPRVCEQGDFFAPPGNGLNVGIKGVVIK